MLVLKVQRFRRFRLWKKLQLKDCQDSDGTSRRYIASIHSESGNDSVKKPMPSAVQFRPSSSDARRNAELRCNATAAAASAASASLRSSQWQRTIAILSQVSASDATQGTSAASAASMVNAVNAVNMVISAWARGSHWLRSLATLRGMQHAQVQPDVVSFNACLNALERQHCLALFDEMTQDERDERDEIADSADREGKECLECLESPESPELPFSPVRGCQADARSVSTTISACAKGGDWTRALQLFTQMQWWRIIPDRHCHTALLSSFHRGKAWQLGLEHILKSTWHGWQNALDDLDGIGYDTSLSLCEAGAWQEALVILARMQKQNLEPSIVGLLSLVKAIQNAKDPQDPQDPQSYPDADLTCRNYPHDCQFRALNPNFVWAKALNAAVGGIQTDVKQSTLQDLHGNIYSKAIALLRQIQKQTSGKRESATNSTNSINSQVVHVVRALDLGEELEGLEGRGLGEELKEVFREVVVTPVLKTLQQTATSVDLQRDFQPLGEIHGLGVHFTNEVLKELRIAETNSSSEWLSTAQSALIAALDKSNVPEEPSARYLLSWVSYLVDPKNTEVQLDDKDFLSLEPGACSSEARAGICWAKCWGHRSCSSCYDVPKLKSAKAKAVMPSTHLSLNVKKDFSGAEFRQQLQQNSASAVAECMLEWLADDDVDDDEVKEGYVEDEEVDDGDVEDDDVEDDEVKEDYVEDDEVEDDDVEVDDVEDDEDEDESAEDDVEDDGGVLAKFLYKVFFSGLLARSLYETSVGAV
eukprot:s965_g19.t1